MKSLENSKSRITKDKIDENSSHLEITEIILVYCNVVNNSSQKVLRVFYIFVPNEFFDQFLEISLTNSIFLKAFISGFSYIQLLFTDKKNIK